jgi:hypothetical protein
VTSCSRNLNSGSSSISTGAFGLRCKAQFNPSHSGFHLNIVLFEALIGMVCALHRSREHPPSSACRLGLHTVVLFTAVIDRKYGYHVSASPEDAVTYGIPALTAINTAVV